MIFVPPCFFSRTQAASVLRAVNAYSHYSVCNLLCLPHCCTQIYVCYMLLIKAVTPKNEMSWRREVEKSWHPEVQS